MKFWKRRDKTSETIFDDLVKIRGGSRIGLSNDPRMNEEFNPYTQNAPGRNWRPRGMIHSMSGIGGRSTFQYNGGNRCDFYRWMRDTIPILSAGVWAWVRLCATPMTRVIEGNDSERQRATQILSDLDQRILESPYGRGSGLTKLTEAYFLELFTTGRFAGEIIQGKDERSIDHFRFVDPYFVSWEHGEQGWIPYITDDDDKQYKFDPNLFFYGVLGNDLSNPLGIEPMACIPFVTEIEQLMLEDMARSSHNAGIPRLQIKISRPERYSWEGDKEYVNRANSYFQDVVGEFQHLEPDDNIFTWSDVEVAVVGQSGAQTAFRLNREQVIEDVITGMRLFPWMLGRTHKTTQNWVQSQFDLLMLVVANHQKSGADLVNWICNTELRLRDVQATVSHRFDSHPDPFHLERVRAQKVEIENIDTKVRRGYISKDVGAREMGYVKAFHQDNEDEI
ncbi:MAG: hypothetical protein P9M15_02735 [Candidatus Electryoneaceae bacterium]|nr:hypothetical protein [Candidatus Electryoneaceae bacterium]